MAVELPNIIVLIGDPEKTLIELLFTEKALEGSPPKLRHLSHDEWQNLRTFCRRREVERHEQFSARPWFNAVLQLAGVGRCVGSVPMWSCEYTCFSGTLRQRRRRSLPTERTIASRAPRGRRAATARCFQSTFMISESRTHITCRDSESDPHALFWNFRFFYLRFRVPLPSCVKWRRFRVLEAMVPMGSLTSSKCPHPAGLHEQAVAA